MFSIHFISEEKNSKISFDVYLVQSDIHSGHIHHYNNCSDCSIGFENRGHKPDISDAGNLINYVTQHSSHVIIDLDPTDSTMRSTTAQESTPCLVMR